MFSAGVWLNARQLAFDTVEAKNEYFLCFFKDTIITVFNFGANAINGAHLSCLQVTTFLAQKYISSHYYYACGVCVFP